MWLARKHTRAALSEIGQFFGAQRSSLVLLQQLGKPVHPGQLRRQTTLETEVLTDQKKRAPQQENQGQKNLIKKVRQCYDRLLIVLLDNPFDCEYSNPQDTCLTSYGLRKRQLLSLVKTIFGKAEAHGRLPFRTQDA